MDTPQSLLCNRRWCGVWLPILMLSAASGCAADSTQSLIHARGSPDIETTIQAAIEDAAQRAGLDVALIRLDRAEPVTWPDGSLGCPQPDMMYTQMVVTGYRIQIVAGERTVVYHAATHGAPILCHTE